ncbi:hypothetical protein WJX73_002907 [Symbiochloris irregularis]|uniref:DNA polymerase eta n=1 Tax=Symbiochloris irregularis TaxID=706552 RepID=A0AAW1NNL2_9CHLO
MGSVPESNLRVILHIDLDCFYCQVEQKRLGIPREKPVAVQQWEGLIAVNYAARAAGITRHMRVAEARQKCPELICCHVQTLGDSGQDGGTVGPPPAKDRTMQKACLERYRQASQAIILLLRSLAPQAVTEKASIDEVYMDVTAIVDAEMRSRNGVPLQSVDSFAWGGIVLGGGPLAVHNEFDRRLAVGACIACRLRGAVFDKLDFTCSAGVAGNKLLAKVASAMNKPNQQTVVPPRAVASLMKDLPLKKLRNFGGKLGEQLGVLGCTTAGEVAALPHAKLVDAFGAARTHSILEAVAGRSTESVEVKDKPQSMLACKSFEPTSSKEGITRWINILAEELASRMAGDYELHARRPRNLVVHYRCGFKGGERSRSAPMPRAPPKGTVLAPAIAELAGLIFWKVVEAGGVLPTTRLAISARDFYDTPHSEQEDSIMHFMMPGNGRTDDSAGHAQHAPSAPRPPSKPRNTIKQDHAAVDGQAARDDSQAHACADANAEEPAGSGEGRGALSGFEGVSVESQRRILRDIHLERDRQNRHPPVTAAGSVSNSSAASHGKRGRPPGAAAEAKAAKPGKQMRISSLFVKK